MIISYQGPTKETTMRNYNDNTTNNDDTSGDNNANNSNNNHNTIDWYC